LSKTIYPIFKKTRKIDDEGGILNGAKDLMGPLGFRKKAFFESSSLKLQENF